jgi:predicted Zn-dependent protease
MTLPRFPARRSRAPARLVAAALLAALLPLGPLGCVTTSLPPVGAEGPFALERDEERLWEEARQEERKLRDKAVLHQDPVLDDYLERVARRLVPPEAAGQDLLSIRVSTIKDPSLNAFTFPNGSVYVHTGLLARLENETQLATVLGHEIAHATGRHALRFRRSAQNKAIGFSLASLAASIAVAGAAGRKAEKGDWSGAYVLNQVGNLVASLGLQLAFLAAVNGYGRDLEREADEEGIARLAAAGYDPWEAPRVFELLQDDKGDGSKLEVFFFGSHPRLQERVESTRELVAARYPGGGGGAAADTREFQMRTRVLVREDAAANLAAGRNGLAESEIRRVLALTPNDPVAHFLLGRLHETRSGQSKDAARARQLRREALSEYEEAIRLDPRYADPYRAIGVLHHVAGEKEKALSAFRQYLELSPEAPDAQQVRDYILELEAA